MRVPLPLGRRLFLGVALLVALALALPARLALGALGLGDFAFAAREVRGTLWRARLSEASLAGLPLGDLLAGLHPLPLLLGRATLGFAGEGEATGEVTVTRHTTTLVADRWRLPTGARFAPLPLTALGGEGVRIRYRDGLCEAAEGQTRVELGGAPAGLALPATMTGPLRCEGGALVLALTDGSGAQRLLLRFPGGGRYRAELVVRPVEAGAAAPLVLLGFAPRGDGDYALAVEGSWD